MKKYKSKLTLKELGVLYQYHQISPQTQQVLKSLRKNGMSYQRIADTLDLSYATVYYYLHPDYRKKCKLKFKNYKVQQKISKEKRHSYYITYRDRRKKILDSIENISQYLYPKRVTMRDKILSFTKIGKEYTYQEIADELGKDISYFYRRIKELQFKGLVKIVKKNNYKFITRVK